MRGRRIRGVALVLPFVVLGWTDASATFPGKNGKIAVSSDRTGNMEIFTINQDGSGATNITNNPASDLLGAWSPDGTKLAFQSNREGNFEIYVMNEDGSGLTRLTDDPAADVTPAWSADGTRIVFSSNRAGNSEIHVMNADGSGVARLTSDPAADIVPHWSPDGSKIAFSTNRDSNFEIYSMAPDGSSPTRLTTQTGNDFASSWAPDGSKIALTSNRDGNFNVYTMNPDGSGQSRLTDHAGADTDPAYSPDGTEITFDSDRSGNLDLWRVELTTAAAAATATATSVPEGDPTPTQVTTDPGLDSGGGESQQAEPPSLGDEILTRFRLEQDGKDPEDPWDFLIAFVVGFRPSADRAGTESDVNRIIAWEIDGKAPLGKRSGRIAADPDGQSRVKLKVKRSYKPGKYTATGILIEVSSSGSETELDRSSASSRLRPKHVPG